MQWPGLSHQLHLFPLGQVKRLWVFADRQACRSQAVLDEDFKALLDLVGGCKLRRGSRKRLPDSKRDCIGENQRHLEGLSAIQFHVVLVLWGFFEIPQRDGRDSRLNRIGLYKKEPEAEKLKRIMIPARVPTILTANRMFFWDMTFSDSFSNSSRVCSVDPSASIFFWNRSVFCGCASGKLSSGMSLSLSFRPFLGVITILYLYHWAVLSWPP